MRRVSWIILVAISTSACASTKFYEREKVAHRAMQIDADGRLVYIRNKLEAAREGSFGGFGGAAVGSCGCQ